VKARKRVVTAGGRKGTKRSPTVRKHRSAIVAAPRRTIPAGAARYVPLSPASVLGAPPAEPSPDAPVDLAVDLAPDHGGLLLANPIVAASGPFGYGVEVRDTIEIDRLGALVTRGTTLRPRPGNPPPRLARTPAGLLNAVGLQNPGIEVIEERYAAQWATWRVPVIVNIAASSVGGFVELAKRVDGLPGVAGVELDLSCPNASRGGLLFGLDAGSAGAVTAAVRRATDLPLLAKLTPAVADVRPIARALVEAGADALTAVNTLPGLALTPERDAPLVGSTYGGLSGPAIRPVALRVVYEVASAVDVPIVATGGVTTLDDVLDYLAVGAVAVGVATAALADLELPIRLVDALAAECRRRGLATYRPLVGTALSSRQSPSSALGAEHRP
jgi:dihydroorotate dehydrogenase (NAD+) catalytic subunit